MANGDCKDKYFYCGDRDDSKLDFVGLYKECPVKNPDDVGENDFDFGMFTDALESGMVLDITDFKVKLSYCFWWGFLNLR